MKPFLLLISVFIVSIVTNKVLWDKYELALSGRIALSAMLFFTAIGHFLFTKGMTLMLPEFIPFKTEIIYITGIIEIIAAMGLHIPNYRVPIAWFIILFFILVLPANIVAVLKRVDYQKATFNGPGLSYLWFRIPLQLFFIIWIYLSVIQFDISI